MFKPVNSRGLRSPLSRRLCLWPNTAQLPSVLNFTWTPQFTGFIASAGTAGSKGTVNLQTGQNGFAPSTPNVTQAATVGGVAPFQCVQEYDGQFTIASGATTNVDLTNLVNGLGGTVDFSGGSTYVKYMSVAILSPDGGVTKSLQVGPQGIANAWIGPFEAATTNFYLNVYSRCVLVDGVEAAAVGTAVSGSNKILGLKNTGSVSLTCQLFVLG